MIFLKAKNFRDNWSQNVSVIEPLSSYVRTCTVINRRFSWRSKGMTENIIKTPFPSGNSFAPKLIYDYGEINKILWVLFKTILYIFYSKKYNK